jgi:hypothetical protein
LPFFLYAYATKQRSARGIERHCRQDVAYRVITANRVPDHATIARFVVRHEAALGELFGSVLELCTKARLVSTGLVAIDGTKVAANANREANLDYERIAREIVAEAKATDGAEDRLYGEARGGELPEELRTREGRRRWLAEAKRGLDTERSGDRTDHEPVEEPPSMPRGMGKDQGRCGWHRDARQRLDERRRARARHGWPSRSAGSRRSSRPSAGRTRHMGLVDEREALKDAKPRRRRGRAGVGGSGVEAAQSRRHGLSDRGGGAADQAAELSRGGGEFPPGDGQIRIGDRPGGRLVHARFDHELDVLVR